ncbi:aminoacyl-histidine dipeptidase [Mediterraneibacter agrestimuris]|uniref:aminoacyl-histidine dipeptidase n=1 Tax=Mediterraneibacter agrestimuris TaxID=2941333 RepID=UPI00203F899F|nr:aminoacyl-histidine dipeptidase [Mediterraneibacter agrestimuris]
MAVFENIEPKKVFHFFEEISRIPRGTYNTKEISDYCVNFAKERGLFVIQDEWNNVIIKKPGTAGYEMSEPVILQGHLDMVCEKTADSGHDFMKDPIEIYVEDGWVKARDTTLGADNGIAVAMALTILDSKDIPHPPLEVIFTIDEEVGMTGALNIDLSQLKGTMLMNLDSEEEDVLIAGCAGGFRFVCSLPIEKTSANGVKMELEICGLRGGHSGVEIHQQRGNANKLAGRLLYHLTRQIKIALIEINGGSKDNVITSANKSVIVAEDAKAVEETAAKLLAKWRDEFGKDEPDLDIKVHVLEEGSFEAMSDTSMKKVLQFIVNCPNGVDEYSRHLAGMVGTSDNLGVITTEKERVDFIVLTRSGIASKIDEFKERFMCLAESLGGTYEFNSEYPAWTFNAESRIREIALDAFEHVYGKRPEVTEIHAGLECGLLSGKKPELDCISFGPNMMDVHSFNERLEIASAAKIWEALKEILKRCK